MLDPYRAADREMSGLTKDIDSMFNSTAQSLPMDELNYTKAKNLSSNLYERLLERVNRVYLRIAKNAIADVKTILKEEGYNEDDVGLVPIELRDGLMSGYNELTGYRFDKEYERKKDRTTEALIAYLGIQERRRALKRARDLVARQIKQYGDLLIDDTYYEAYEQAGVSKVMWVTEKDEKVCSICRERDGKVYPLSDVPGKPHLNCRCHIRPVKRSVMK